MSLQQESISPRMGRMIAKFLKALEQRIERPDGRPVTPYYMAVHVFGVAPQQYDRYRDESQNARSLPVKAVTAARENSGLSWEEWGSLWDKYIGKIEKG